ncbi:aquaporin [Deinococcus misasensis]|uniref:aquaporin n=1 Tax=Deinococcus misasensis TaxID=392413 RepID=UPI001B806C27|nr:aquaporin [Deinococcus misasensis]
MGGGVKTHTLLLCGVGALVITAIGTLNARLLEIALGHGMGVMFMAYSVGSISRAHFNPAVLSRTFYFRTGFGTHCKIDF